jgi:lipopolysaccharide assembly outer membrane protein LptD (OstA)
MKGKRLYLIVLLILVTAGLPAASGEQYYAASSSLSYYLGIPHFEDEIPARSSMAVSTTIGFLGYQGSNWETALQAHLYSVSDSLPFGNYRARGFNSLGLSILASWSLSDRFSLFIQGGSEVNFYKQIEEVFASFSFKLGPQFLIAEEPTYQMHLIVPLSVHLRKEITALQAGIGIRYLLFPFKRGDT